MKIISFAISLAFLFSICNAQDCTKEMAAAQPGVFERATGQNGNRAKDPALKKTGDEINAMILASLKGATGLHGFYDVDGPGYGSGGLASSSAFLYAYKIHCQVGERFSWKGMWNFEITCKANSVSHIAEDTHSDNIGVGGNKELFINGSPVYIIKSAQPHSKIKGYSYYEFDNNYDGVLVTRSGVPLFRPVTRREYLILMRKEYEAALPKQKKELAVFLKDKQAAQAGSEVDKGNKEVEALYNKSINDIIKAVEEIGRFSSSQSEAWMNSACITNYRLTLPFNKSLAKEKDYFQETAGLGNEWVIINPDYLSKNVAATAPRFFYVSWRKTKSQFDKEKSIAETKAIELFKANFDFAKLALLLK